MTSQLLMTAVLAGVFHVVGLIATYRAFEIGTLSIVSPIASSFAIVTAVLALANGEKPGIFAIFGALLLIVGVVVVTRGMQGDSAVTSKGILEAIISALAFGIMFWMIDSVTDKVGMAPPLVILKVMMTATSAYLWWSGRKKVSSESVKIDSKVWLIAGGVALADSLAWLAWMIGIKTSYSSIVTALASLFSAVTVVLAAIFLKERLNKVQLAGVAVILVGVLIVSM